MKLKLIAVGTKMPAWVVDGFTEYQKRMPSKMPLELIEIQLASRTQGSTAEQLKKLEADKIEKALGRDDFIVALDVLGKAFPTEKLATHLANWQLNARDVALLVGGPDGLDAGLLAKVDMKWSLSPLTLPHPMVRIILAEQLYRAWSINNNHPYHRQ